MAQVAQQTPAHSPSRSIHPVLRPQTAMGQGILEGVTAYVAEHHLPWQFGLIPILGNNQPQEPAGPPHADALLGIVTEQMAQPWTAEQRRRVVNVSRGHQPEGIASVCCDDHAIGRMAADYLLGKGLQHFASFGWASQRDRTFAQRIAEAGGHYPFGE